MVLSLQLKIAFVKIWPIIPSGGDSVIISYYQQFLNASSSCSNQSEYKLNLSGLIFIKEVNMTINDWIDMDNCDRFNKLTTNIEMNIKLVGR